MNSIENIYEGLEILPMDLRGWNGTSEVFHKLIETTNPNIIVEVGTWKGQSAINMGKYIKDTKRDTKIYCIDTWLGACEFWTTHKDTEERDLLLKNGYPQIYYQFLSNVVHSDLTDVIIPFPNTSDIGFEYLQSIGVEPELIYIDASHTEADVYRDVSNYYTLLKTGGNIFGDDYFSWPGVRKAVDLFTSQNNIQVTVLEQNFWIINKH